MPLARYIRGKRIYRSHNPIKIIALILSVIIVLALVFVIFVFFWFQNYITYTADGIRLEVPWLEEDVADAPPSNAADNASNSDIII